MDLICPVCLDVYFKPIKLPCNHKICQECLERSLDISTLRCPICRLRLSVWKRRLKDITKCLDQALDIEIKRLFPCYYSAKSKGIDVSLSESEVRVLHDVTNSDRALLQAATPGSVKSEFDEILSRTKKRDIAEDGLREEASLALSRHLLLENNPDNYSVDPGLQSDPKEPELGNSEAESNPLFATSVPILHFGSATTIRTRSDHSSRTNEWSSFQPTLRPNTSCSSRQTHTTANPDQKLVCGLAEPHGFLGRVLRAPQKQKTATSHSPPDYSKQAGSA